ncbi:hypothetical protein MEO_01271 [Candida albicans P94015]|nr:hypothetical protein MEO_01271 [Candida albicans P94015]
MLYALATPGSAFKPSIKKARNTWRLQKFKKLYIQKGGYISSSPTDSSINSNDSISSSSSVITASSSAPRFI